MKYPTISDIPEVQAAYEAMRHNGTVHSLAEMLALRQPPGSGHTDRSFFQGHGCHDNGLLGLHPTIQEAYLAKARAAGVEPSGKYYYGGLADDDGDPKAWCSSLQDYQDKAKRATHKEFRGAVNIKRSKPDPTPAVPLAPDIVERYMKKAIAAQPDKPKRAWTKRELATLRSDIVAKHGTKRKLMT